MVVRGIVVVCVVVAGMEVVVVEKRRRVKLKMFDGTGVVLSDFEAMFIHCISCVSKVHVKNRVPDNMQVKFS